MHTAYMCSARTTTGQRRPTWSSALWRWHRSSRSSSGAVRMASWHGGGYCWWWMVWESTSLHSHISHGGNGWKWMEMERMEFFCELCKFISFVQGALGDCWLYLVWSPWDLGEFCDSFWFNPPSCLHRWFRIAALAACLKWRIRMY